MAKANSIVGEFVALGRKFKGAFPVVKRSLDPGASQGTDRHAVQIAKRDIGISQVVGTLARPLLSLTSSTG
jgi:hypothetical protein